MVAVAPAAGLSRIWSPGRPVDLARTLGPLRRGAGDPAYRRIDGVHWLAARTPAGASTLALSVAGGEVRAQAWGPGADWSLDRVPRLLGDGDDWSGLDVSAYPGLVRLLRAAPGLRLPSTGLVMAALVPAVLEQRVTGGEARASWRELLLAYGEPAPGPVPVTMAVPPTPRDLLDVPTWDWSRWSVDLNRQRAIRAAATVAARLEECADLAPDAAVARLRLIPGIGAWTAAETTQRAIGHPDAVSVNDFHLHNQVVYALTGRARGTDEEMLELLQPWAGQRQRVVRLIEIAGITAPRFGPRMRIDRPRGS